MTDLIIAKPGTKLNNLQRRTLARAEMFHFPDSSLFLYLKTSSHIRHLRMTDGTVEHSMVDMMNVVYAPKRKDAKPDFDPNTVWQDTRRRFKGDDEIMENIHKLNLPSWDDAKWYPTDTMSSGWLFILLLELKTPYTNRIRRSLANRINQFDREAMAFDIGKLDKELHGVGSSITLHMQSIYEVGDYDESEWWQK